MTSTIDLAANIEWVEKKIEESCLAAGRDRSEVSLMLVTKTVPPDRISQAHELGYRLFGENKIQEVAGKWGDPALNSHKPEFIGHLQTNKVKTCLDLCSRIHSVDRMNLVEALNRELLRRGERREVFIQVNTSQEESKYGVSLNEALDFAKQVSRYDTIEVTGLMTLALFSKEDALVRKCFQNLRDLQRTIQRQDLFGKNFRHLSMGMSSDYPIAIQEGATLVRVGTAIFGARATPDSFYWPERKTED